jgi:hypothetical protein
MTSAEQATPPQISSLLTKLASARVTAIFQYVSAHFAATESCSSRFAPISATEPHTHAFGCEYAPVSPHPYFCAFSANYSGRQVFV